MNDSDMLINNVLFVALDKLAETDDEAMDAVMGHGYLTAQAISPAPDSPEEICEALFGNEDAPGTTREELITAISKTLADIDTQLNGDIEELDIPVIVEDDEDLLDSALADWCSGFLETHIQQEKQWLDKDEQGVAELLLPVAALSGVFADEPDFEAITNNASLLEDMAAQLPEILVELYLLMRTE